MSVDTRTPRPSPGGGTPGFDEPVLTMARVPSDPAQVIVTHASFRVQLGRTSARALARGQRGQAVPRAAQQHTAPTGRRRLAPMVWSGRTEPGDAPAGELFQAVHGTGSPDPDGAAGATTQVLPRIGGATVLPPTTPTVVGPRNGEAPTTGLLGGVRPARGAFDEEPPAAGYDAGYDLYGDEDDEDELHAAAPRRERPVPKGGDFVKHAWYPGRRMNLGIVLLPLRIFLGFVSIYAGMGKLCDRVYFDGGRRGSMVTWLNSLHPWAAAEPLRDAALNHPVGAGLSIAFLQVVVGVLTVFGLWQRVAAVFGAALSVALLVTVSWRTVPVYDAPDFIYLAAWSPLVIAGAPVYSVDGKLASDAWRRLGPRVGLWGLRRYVLRRGVVLGTLIVGCSLLIGSVLGAAVRASTTPGTHQVGPAGPPVNELPGQPLPEVSGDDDGNGPGSPAAPTLPAEERKKPQPETSTQPPGSGTEDGAAPHTPGSGSHTPGGAGSTGGTPGGSGGGSSGGSGGTSQPPAAPPTHADPPPPPPAPKPTQGGAIGGLLGAGLLGAPEPSAVPTA
ncbi:DoxX family protein [Streptomyces sp. NPDC020983]|uniref:DoxX family protein n=1 Tax=Streptomyces sp. NPDC020983 TaxID=3365106 RepID=UPI00378B5200